MIAEDALQQAHVGEPRNVVEDERLVGEQARDHQRQRGVLGARDRDRAVELRAARDANAIHAPSPTPLPAQPPMPVNAARPVKRKSAPLARPRLAFPLSSAIPAESWVSAVGRRPALRPARALACALRRLRFSRSAAASRRCGLAFCPSFARSVMASSVKPLRQGCAVSGLVARIATFAAWHFGTPCDARALP